MSAKRKARRGGGGRKPAAAAPGARRRRAAGRTPAPSVRPRDTAAQPTPQWLRTIVVSAAALGSLGIVLALWRWVLFGRQLWYGFYDISDITVYFDYAQRMANGARPYRDFPVEYPPLAVPLFTLPGRTAEVWAYADRFAAEMLVCVASPPRSFWRSPASHSGAAGSARSPPSSSSRSASPSRVRSSPTATTPSSPCCSPSSSSAWRAAGGRRRRSSWDLASRSS